MKIYIGPYTSWIGPYQIAEKLCFWAKKEKDEIGIKHSPDWVHDFGTWLANDKDGNDSWLTKLCVWVESKRKRKVKIRIDKYDTWNMDGTLSMIILPMLKQLHATKHGSPLVDDEDVPEHLRSTSAPPKENEWDTDENHHKRWEWVMEELIWTFENLHPDNDWESKYFECGEFLREQYDIHNNRINNGLRLFGKYYRGLWD